MGFMWVVLYIRVPFGVPITRVPNHIGDPKRDPNLRTTHVAEGSKVVICAQGLKILWGTALVEGV